MIKIAFRSLVRNKVFAFINIFGLATGLATCLLIMLYIFDESSYDKHQQDAERIYRVSASVQEGKWASQPAPMAAALKKDFPEVEYSARLLKFPGQDRMLLRYEGANDNKQFFETDGYYVDKDFFQIFSYNLVKGDRNNALSEPNSIVISTDIATKLFGNTDPLGKQVKVGLSFGEFVYTVKGVFDNGNNKSHIPARFFLSMKNNAIGGWVDQLDNWAMNSIFHTYVKLKKSADAEVFGKKLRPFMEQHGGDDMKAAGFKKDLFLQPLSDIYLHSNIGNEIAPNGNLTYLYILASIAAFILIIACINFMNLSTARSEKRAREVGIRKVVGAEKSSLVAQFLGESFVMCLLALVLAIIITISLLPLFNQLTQKNLWALDQPILIVWIVALTFITGLLSGVYPAFYLSSFKPISVLKGKIINSLSATGIRKGLVVFQFTISICLVLGAIVILHQLSFLQSQSLGFNTENQIVLPLQNDRAVNNYQVLKSELLKRPFVKSVTSGSNYPGMNNILNSMLFYAEGKTTNEHVDIHLSTVENDYFKTLGLKIISGRPFSEEFTGDSASIVLNETALAQLGYSAESALGKKVHYDWQNKQHTLEIVGVVKDFNYESLHNPIKPFGFATTFFGNKYSFAILNVHSANYKDVLSELEQIWSKTNPGIPFNYSFLDEDIQKNYEQDQRTSQIVVYFTVVAVLIACLGLFGLAAFSAEQRIREIGIRKVLGASVPGITLLISRDFLKLVLISIAIATPMALWGMNEWLQNFAYRVNIEWWMFLIAGMMALIIAFLTISVQAIKAALANPINSLRSE